LPGSFVLLGLPHLVSICLTFALPLVLAVVVRRKPGADLGIRLSLALLVSCGWIGWYIMFAVRGWLSVGNELPINLCDWAAIALVITLLNPNQKSFELGYFWGLCGTMHGLLTPPVHHAFPDFEFIVFFIYHGGIIASILYLTLGPGWRPVPRSMIRAFLATLIYAAVAGTSDWVLGVNYGLLRAKPDNVSILDLLSPWPWYIPELVLIGGISILFYYAPFFWIDRRTARRGYLTRTLAIPALNFCQGLRSGRVDLGRDVQAGNLTRHL
jgi:hypothetical integral membrane protein (TIGR02206 family)